MMRKFDRLRRGESWLDERLAMAGICCGDKGGSAPAPDYTPVAQASEKAAQISADLGREQLAENKRQYENNMAVAKPIIDKQSALMDQQLQQGNDYYNYQKSISRPTEKSMFYEAMGLSPEEIQQYEQMRSGETSAANEKRQQMVASSVASMPQAGSLTADEQKELAGLIGGGQGGTSSYTLYNGDQPQVFTDKAALLKKLNENDDSGLAGLTLKQYLAGQRSTLTDDELLSKALQTGMVTANGGGAGLNDTQKARVQELLGKMGANNTLDISKGLSSVAEDTSGSDAYLAKASAAAGQRLEDNAANQALADARVGTTQQQNQLIRQGMRYGLSPEAMASAAGLSSVGATQASVAGANAARTQQKALTWGKKLDVDNSVKGLTGASQNAYSLANQSGNSAVGNQNSTSAQYLNGMAAGTGTIMQGQGMKISGLSSAINGQAAAYNADQARASSSAAGIGSLIGTVAGAAIMASSKDFKTDKESVSDEAILDKLKRIPVEKWKYKDGIADGDEHVGPYAEDMNDAFGDAVAPGGVGLDAVSMNGISIAAIKALATKQDRLQKTVAGLVTKLADKRR